MSLQGHNQLHYMPTAVSPSMTNQADALVYNGLYPGLSIIQRLIQHAITFNSYSHMITEIVIYSDGRATIKSSRDTS